MKNSYQIGPKAESGDKIMAIFDRAKKLIPQSIKNIYHLFQAVLANLLYGFPARRSYAHSIAGGPSKNIKIIGVTGTNGKTTTVQMIARILEEAGFKVAMNSTINFKIGKKEWTNKTKFTTLSSFSVQKFIRDSVKAGCDYLVLETSSHSLDQYRVWGVEYDVAVITNITREHFDYHKTMEKYRKAKLKLFSKVKTAVINLDMEKPEDFLGCGAEKEYGYTAKIQNENRKLKIIEAKNIESGPGYSRYQIQDIKYEIHLPGLFNIENALAAACVGLSEGISLETISKALEKIKGIPGRMENVLNDKGLNIIIDYAVTPDSLKKLYAVVKEINTDNKKVIAVFGSCGERDRGKRPMMGEIVSNVADYIVLTNEDPYKEDPWQIINEIASGVKNKKGDETFWKIMDRREAIKKALLLAKPGDFVVITGKGAEETMAVGKERIPWSDKEVILEELMKL